MRFFRVLLCFAAFLLPSSIAAQESNESNKCCADPQAPATVVVNGVSEPVYQPGKGVSIPRATYRPVAEYSDKARKKKIQGLVMISAVILSTGDVTAVHVEKGLGYGLDEKAVDAVRRWKFEPAMKDGKPVSVSIKIETNFHLY